jgi:hypothetical protein
MRTPNPIYASAKSLIYSPDWIPKTYVGLMATANPAPASLIQDFLEFQTTKGFRALTYCHLILHIDDDTGGITGVEQVEEITDPGYTPPFRKLDYPLAAAASITEGIEVFKATWSSDYHKGDESDLSEIVVKGRHKNTAIDNVPAEESVLADALVKFRAGKITDELGLAIGCKYHVPWVWCETVLTYSKGRFKLYGSGSIFPSHAWYLDDRQVMSKAQVMDLSFPRRSNPFEWEKLPHFFEINVPALLLYPVLSKGAPSSGPQVSDRDFDGAVFKHPNTVASCGVLTNVGEGKVGLARERGS